MLSIAHGHLVVGSKGGGPPLPVFALGPWPMLRMLVFPKSPRLDMLTLADLGHDPNAGLRRL